MMEPAGTDNLKEWAAHVSKIATSKGWQEPTWENLVSKLAFAICELNEARDGVIGKGKDPLEVELADTAIRIMTVLHAIFPDWSDGRVTSGRSRRASRPNVFRSIETVLWSPLRYITDAIESWRKSDPNDVQINLELALLELFRAADCCGIDLMDEIRKKSIVNAGRPPRHGMNQNVG